MTSYTFSAFFTKVAEKMLAVMIVLDLYWIFDMSPQICWGWAFDVPLRSWAEPASLVTPVTALCYVAFLIESKSKLAFKYPYALLDLWLDEEIIYLQNQYFSKHCFNLHDLFLCIVYLCMSFPLFSYLVAL